MNVGAIAPQFAMKGNVNKEAMMYELHGLLQGERDARTLADRHAAGRELRSKVPRSSHAEWTPAANRPDPLSLLEE